MSQQTDSAFKTFTAGEALGAYTRVKLSAGTIVYADSEEAAIGVTQAAIDSGAEGCVKLIPGPGSFKVKAAGAISASAAVYAADDGEVDNAGTTARGFALEAATADGDIIECLLSS